MSMPMSFDLEGARVLVTAGASGIGLATARSFAQQGARVHVCDVDDAALDALGTTDATIFSTSTLPANTWSHIALTYDGSNERFYLNGNQVSIVAQTGSIVT